MILTEGFFEVFPVLVYISIVVPSLELFLEDSRIVDNVVGRDEDSNVGVQAMLFEELHAVLNALEDNHDLCGGVKGLFYLGVVATDISGG